jgi:hypothetical protein
MKKNDSIETVREIIDSSLLDSFITLPESFKNKKVEITVRAPVEEEPAEEPTEKVEADETLSPAMKRLLGAVKLPKDFDYKEVLTEALMEKYL